MKNVFNVIVLVGKCVDAILPIVSNVVKAVQLWRDGRKEQKERKK